MPKICIYAEYRYISELDSLPWPVVQCRWSLHHAEWLSLRVEGNETQEVCLIAKNSLLLSTLQTIAVAFRLTVAVRTLKRAEKLSHSCYPSLWRRNNFFGHWILDNLAQVFFPVSLNCYLILTRRWVCGVLHESI